MTQIAPTVGRVVLYRPRPGVEGEERPTLAAIVAAVIDPDCLVLSVIDANGNARGVGPVHHRDVTVLRLVEIEGAEEVPLEERDFWEWMPYQLGQAAKTEDEIGPLRARIEELETKAAQAPTVAEASKKAIAAEIDRQLDAALERLKGA